MPKRETTTNDGQIYKMEKNFDIDNVKVVLIKY